MEEAVRNRVILILGVLTIIFFVTTVSSCSNAYRNKLARDKEIMKRMDLEEKVSKLSQEKTKQNENLNSLQKDMEGEKADYEETKKALVEERLVNQSLKEELIKVTKLKEALEEDLKKALIQAKAGTPTTIKTKQ